MSPTKSGILSSIIAVFLLSDDPGPSFAQSPRCCEDIEARLDALNQAAIERQGINPALKVSGQVNRAALIWDDGIETDAFVADNIYSSSRVILSGKAKVSRTAAAGFQIEIEYRDAGSITVLQGNDEGSDEANETNSSIRLRQGFWSLADENFGSISLGQLAPITNSLIYYKLWEVIVHTSPDVFYNTAFLLRNGSGDLTGLRWGSIASALDSPRGDFIKYDSPSIQGFAFSADWGENDVYDIALTYDAAFDAVKIAAAIGYYNDQEITLSQDLRASLLLMHVPSGLYGQFGGIWRDFDTQGRRDAAALYGHLGVKTKLFTQGATLIYGEYGFYDNLLAGRGVVPPDGLGSAGGDGPAEDFIAATRVERWGFGVMQHYDAAALEVYALYSRYDAAVDIADDTGAQTGTLSPELKPWSSLVIGSRIKF